MLQHRVIAIDPAPGKESTVFDGEGWSSKSAIHLREFVDQIAKEGSETLVCWDAPLTGPTNPARAGACGGDFTQRPIEKFFSRLQEGFKTPTGISVQGYAGCQHWTISRSLVGLPRVGRFDMPRHELPFHLIPESAADHRQRPRIVEIHPALAAWLWCRNIREAHANWVYKGRKEDSDMKARALQDMWDIVLRRTGFHQRLPAPETDDQFDAAIGFILGWLFLENEAGQNKRKVGILGDPKNGAFLVPYERELFDAWHNSKLRCQI